MTKHLKTSILFLLTLGLFELSSAQMNPTYVAYVGANWSGPVHKNAFLAQSGVGASNKMNEQHWEHLSVDSFKLIVMRDSSIILNYRNIGNIFEIKLKEGLKTIQVGDRILIYDIWTKLHKGKEVLLQPLEYIIE
jgi:hypothetical protein